jgi:predicted nucleic acid-binding protein
VADTSALVSLASVSLLPLVLSEFDVVVTDIVIGELKAMSTFDDAHGRAATEVLAKIDSIEVVNASDYQRFMTSRIDSGEASCLEIIDGGKCDYLLTDDFRALGEIEKQIGDAVVLSPIILKVLVMRGTIGKSEALAKLGEIARKRDWLGRPIYRYAMRYFDEGLSESQGRFL